MGSTKTRLKLYGKVDAKAFAKAQSEIDLSSNFGALYGFLSSSTEFSAAKD